MGIFKYIRDKKNFEEKSQNNILTDEASINSVLEDKIEKFFPKDGEWLNTCFYRPKQVLRSNMPCHLRDIDWLSSLMYEELIEKGIRIPKSAIKKFMKNSKTFEEFRHNYELEIVKWQINFVLTRNDGWLLPRGFNEWDLMFGSDIEELVRGGVIKTLSKIGMDKDVIEEGVEKFSDMWRNQCIELGFRHAFEPVSYLNGMPPSADFEHKKNWIAAREFTYYHRHKDVMDKFGKKTPSMNMTTEEYFKLCQTLSKQSAERKAYLREWEKNQISKQCQYK